MGDILFLAHRVPYPPDRGDKIRSYHILRHLAARRRAHLCAFVDSAAETQAAPELVRLTQSRTLVHRRRGRAASAARALLRGQPVSIAAFEHRAMAAAVGRVLAERDIETIYLFSGQMAQYVPADVRARVVMDFVDMDAAKFAAYAEDARPPLGWLYRREARLLLAHDRAVAARADASIFVSDAEVALFRRAGGGGQIVAVENGIDTASFDPAARFERIDAPGEVIVFTGQMDYPPNVAAVRWFVGEVLPLVRARRPRAHFAIVGRNPTAAVQALAGDTATVTGEVADVRGWLAAARVVVAPLQLARGVQNKVLEAMAMARPVVATSGAAEGIDHGGTLVSADDAADFAAAVTRLLDDPAAAEAQGRAARARVVERYGWGARLAPLDGLLGLTAERRSAA